MALPSTGPISMADIATELGISAAGLSLDDARVRALAGISSGPISFDSLRGKSAVTSSTMVAQYTEEENAGWLGYGEQWFGSLSVGINPRPSMIENFSVFGNTTSLVQFIGDYRTQLTGKSFLINGAAQPMNAPTYSTATGQGVTSWNRTSGIFPIVDGGTYTVSIV